jgi:Cof subfamily protein (haloacid dehalogenase superfamily)
MEKRFSKIFAFDLDGTLVHEDKNGQRLVPEGLRRCLFELSKVAHLVIATGRRIRSAEPVIKEMPPMEFSIFHNGLLIRQRDGSIPVHRKISRKSINEVVEILGALSVPAFLVLDGKLNHQDFVFENRSILENDDFRYVREKSNQHSFSVDQWEDLSDEWNDHVLEVAIIGSYEKLVEIQKILTKSLPASLKAVVVRNCGYDGRSVLEIYDSSASKRSGVEFVKQRLGASEVVAVGDDENDLEMLEWADVGVVMKHAMPHIRERATLEVDGAKGLEDYLWENWLR